MKDIQAKIGKIIEASEERDAIHVAVVPVEAGETLPPGQRVYVADGKAWITREKSPASVGIVDPFLRSAVYEGQRFWLLLPPGTITSLRHEWVHPAFVRDDEERVRAAQEWIANWAGSYGEDYNEVIWRAKDYIHSGEYWIEGGRFEGEYVPAEFWEHFEIATGEKVPDKRRGSFFSCSC